MIDVRYYQKERRIEVIEITSYQSTMNFTEVADIECDKDLHISFNGYNWQKKLVCVYMKADILIKMDGFE